MDMSMRPHPDWRAGEKQAPPIDTLHTIEIDPANESVPVIYPLVISAVVPRPIAFISSLSKEGLGNLSPYSYFNAVAHDPPVLAIGHSWSGGKPKDSLRNTLETGEFVVSIISEWFLESANHTCGAYSPEVNELQLSNFTPVPSVKVKPPRIGESAVNMECKLIHTYDLKNSKGETTTTIVLGEVLLFHIAEGAASRSPSGKVVVDKDKIQAMSRWGGNFYGKVTQFYEIPRPSAKGLYPGEPGFKK